MKYQTLVRDKIPEIIREKGETAITRIASEEEYIRELRKKLRQEVEGFLQSRNIDDLVDVIELVYALSSAMGVPPKELERFRAQKAEERGGFEEGIILVETKL
jgi:predicted house-cleaning noncanonical NTP pyrophosphatase (MazG superfamily)